MSRDQIIIDRILALSAARGACRTICPSEVARDIAGADEAQWRPLMVQIKDHAIRLARAGDIEIRQKGAVVDPDTVTGIYRIAIIES